MQCRISLMWRNQSQRIQISFISAAEDLVMAHFHPDSSMGITVIGHSKSPMKSKLHHWFESLAILLNVCGLVSIKVLVKMFSNGF